MSRPFETLQPPPVEAMAVAYFTPLMSPTPVATRLPEPDQDADTTEGFLRIEAAGGSLLPDTYFWDMAVLLHAYSPNEPQAESLISKAVAWGSNATGVTTTVAALDWYVTFSRATSLPTKQQDPLVDLTRYRAMVSWRIPGNLLA